MLLNNLIDNALKSDAGHVSVICMPSDSRITLSVSDDGRGMDAAALARATEPFYRADKSRSRAQGGAGLGLSLCAEIARLHGTALNFESTPGQGTRISFTLPEKEVPDDEEA